MKNILFRWIVPALIGVLVAWMLRRSAVPETVSARVPVTSQQAREQAGGNSSKEAADAEAWIVNQMMLRYPSPLERVDEISHIAKLSITVIPRTIVQALLPESGHRALLQRQTRSLLVSLLMERLVKEDLPAACSLVDDLNAAATIAIELSERQAANTRLEKALRALVLAWAHMDVDAASVYLARFPKFNPPHSDCTKAIAAQKFLTNPTLALQVAALPQVATHFLAAWQRDPAAMSQWLADQAEHCSQEQPLRVRQILSAGLAEADPAAAMKILAKSPAAFTSTEAWHTVEKLLGLRFRSQELGAPEQWREFATLPEQLYQARTFDELCRNAMSNWPGNERHAERLEVMFQALPPPCRTLFATSALSAVMCYADEPSIALWTQRLGEDVTNVRDKLTDGWATWHAKAPSAADEWAMQHQW